MDDYKRESLYGDEDFKEYEFISDEGSFECEYVGRWMNKDDNLVCCFDFDDGRKVRSMHGRTTAITSWSRFLSERGSALNSRCPIPARTT